MKTKANLLYNTKVKIKLSKLLSTHKTKIVSIEKPNAIIKFRNNILFKEYSLIKHSSSLGKEICSICTFKGNISPLTTKSLLTSRTFLRLKFCVDKRKYTDYSSVIYENLEDLHSRVIRLFSLVKIRLMDKGLEYVDDTYELTEDLFNKILNCLDGENYNDYSEITDKVIISEIIKHFRSAI